ncbi:Cytochrome P450 89A2 like [Actinidia chinensis var. chinensis]|uniref:Cytochrome P450 89A2 like n=1 Tax=Actinidia chinensis var. chinensis TaxID=1590841 RepID=A0A2R6Q9N2_ACTCC|nr:Cytochrome P450 89A2 like [Actinidia chinensis var. chinensis]
METWFIILISLCIPALLKSLIGLIIYSQEKKQKLPPGPITVPVIGNFLWLRNSFSELEPVLWNLRDKYGPIITLRIGSRPAIFVASHKVAHHALVHNGALFSDRPKVLPASDVLTSNQHIISSATYGPTWRTLRRNLTSEILHPSRVKSYSGARRWVLGILIHRLVVDSTSAQVGVGVGAGVRVVDHFQYAMFCLLVLMCFGDRLQEKQIKEIETVQRQMLLSLRRFDILNFWPILGKTVFRNRWKELFELRQNQEKVLIPLIRSRMELVKQRQQQQPPQGKQDPLDQQVKEELEEEDHRVAYVDTLVDLELPDGKRKLEEGDGEPMQRIKMMPFGAGRRICPGFNLALLHLELFVANLIWYFQWTPAPAHDPVDLSEKQEFTVVMKNPLHAHLIPRHPTALPLP